MKRIAKDFRELQLAIPGDGIFIGTITALIDGEITVYGFEFTEVNDEKPALQGRYTAEERTQEEAQESEAHS